MTPIKDWFSWMLPGDRRQFARQAPTPLVAYFWTGELPHHDPAHVEGVVESHQAAADVAAEELAR